MRLFDSCEEMIRKNAGGSSEEVVCKGLEIWITVLIRGARGSKWGAGRDDDVVICCGDREEKRTAADGKADVGEEVDGDGKVGGLEEVADENLRGRRLIWAA